MHISMLWEFIYYFSRNPVSCWFLWRYAVCVKMIKYVLRTAWDLVSIKAFPLVSDTYLHYSLTNPICIPCQYFWFSGFLWSYDSFHLLLKNPQRSLHLDPSKFSVLFCFKMSWLVCRFTLEIGWHSELGLRECNDSVATWFIPGSGISLYNISLENKRIIYMVFIFFKKSN